MLEFAEISALVPFSTPTGDYAQNRVVSAMAMFQHLSPETEQRRSERVVPRVQGQVRELLLPNRARAAEGKCRLKHWTQISKNSCEDATSLPSGLRTRMGQST